MRPEFDQGVSPWPVLVKAVGTALPPDAVAAVRIFPCDRDADGCFVRFAGLDRARLALWRAQSQGSDLPALLILGMLPDPHGPAAGGPQCAAVLDWRGAQYLRYGFDRFQLQEAARTAVNGRREALPVGLGPSIDDMRRNIGEVRHWLENRRRNAEGAHAAFAEAAGGAVALHPYHLEPVAALSDRHREMLERLWALEPPGTEAFRPLKANIESFEARWGRLEARRAELRTAADRQCRGPMEAMLEAQREAGLALSRAIEAAKALDRELAGLSA